VSLVLRSRRTGPGLAGRHLDDLLSAYADRSLPAATLLGCDQHVAICPGCLAAVGAERRLLSSLRSSATPGLPSRLDSALRDLGDLAEDLAELRRHSGPSGRPAPLAVVAPASPALHHSPVRAAVLAGLVASASAAAAWSLTVGGAGASGASSPVATPAMTACRWY